MRDVSISERLDPDHPAELEGSTIATTDPEEDWLDEGLPDLSSISHHYIDLTKEFDISRYLDILADEVNSEVPHRNISSMALASGLAGNRVDKLSDASTIAPLPLAWTI